MLKHTILVAIVIFFLGCEDKENKKNKQDQSEIEEITKETKKSKSDLEFRPLNNLTLEWSGTKKELNFGKSNWLWTRNGRFPSIIIKSETKSDKYTYAYNLTLKGIVANQEDFSGSVNIGSSGSSYGTFAIERSYKEDGDLIRDRWIMTDGTINIKTLNSSAFLVAQIEGNASLSSTSNEDFNAIKPILIALEASVKF